MPKSEGLEYHKGNQKSGGGGKNAGGGKKGRPQGGYEKGDIVRDEALNAERDIKAKPGPRKKLKH